MSDTTQRVYFENDAALADAGAATSLETARALVLAMGDRAKIAADQATAVEKRLTAMKNGSNAIRELRSNMRNEHDKVTLTAFETMVLDQSTDHEANATASARRMENIAWFTSGLTYWENVTLPKMRVEAWRADAAMLRKAGGLVMSQALEVAVLRHEALIALIAIDHTATITSSGRTHDLLIKGLEFYRRAAEADDAADAEEQRQRALEGLN